MGRSTTLGMATSLGDQLSCRVNLQSVNCLNKFSIWGFNKGEYFVACTHNLSQQLNYQESSGIYEPRQGKAAVKACIWLGTISFPCTGILCQYCHCKECCSLRLFFCCCCFDFFSKFKKQSKILGQSVFSSKCSHFTLEIKGFW